MLKIQFLPYITLKLNSRWIKDLCMETELQALETVTLSREGFLDRKGREDRRVGCGGAGAPALPAV